MPHFARLAPVLAPVVALAAAAALTGCAKHTEPPGTYGVCYHVVPEKDGALKYNQLVKAANLETCAANLEAMRLKFLSMGGNTQEILGAYQANYIWVLKTGIFTSTSLEGPRFPALVRTGDGRLAVPGAMPQEPSQ